MTTYQVQPGRVIARDGQPIISIHRIAGFDPVDADRITHEIVEALMASPKRLQCQDCARTRYLGIAPTCWRHMTGHADSRRPS